ncbi:family 16 glycosylhydrolase [Gayadomonas joobiniege]|uniref:family 16 glycosylhydrolase n=1 Tax=Gayadomonas joobiniege TaxID=1234606 RepID=UPI000369DBDF|nr:family 16 glycosylhydrolase [Gayadomonas joobiniege]
MTKFMLSWAFIAPILTTLQVNAEPPKPPLGKKWVLNEKFSDEFNGTELDKTKWYDYHPTWAGREPGIFLPSQITVKEGLLRIKGEKLPQDKVITSGDIVTEEGTPRTYSVAGGAVISKTEDAYFGYYEARFKAAKTTMSTTFWLATRNWDFAGPEDCKDRYGLELDIQESIGREGNFDGKVFAKGMHSNGHFWYAGCDGKMQDLRSPQVTFKSEQLASDSFNTYGGWWHNESSASFYYNNGKPKFMAFYNEVKEKPFDQPMGVNLVSETYPFPWVELPNDEELADPDKNVAYYDWVRAYKLVDAKLANDSASLSETSALPAIYNDQAQIETDAVRLVDQNTLSLLLTYKINQDSIIRITLSDELGVNLATSKLPVEAGYAFMPIEIITSQSLTPSQHYRVSLQIETLNTVQQAPLVFAKTFVLPIATTWQSQFKKNLPTWTLSPEQELKVAGERAVFQYSIRNQKNESAQEGISYNNQIDVRGLDSGEYTIVLDGVLKAKFKK